MIRTLTLTSKRQATFPVRLCEEMHLRCGDRIQVERRTLDGSPAWVLRPKPSDPMTWFGKLRPYAQGKPHDLPSIRESIARGKAESIS
jgi:bifunctional DNA-binding transcriptional regulator/antitoxin component of YhaV-PrlF toxin-antitoxin module